MKFLGFLLIFYSAISFAGIGNMAHKGIPIQNWMTDMAILYGLSGIAILWIHYTYSKFPRPNRRKSKYADLWRIGRAILFFVAGVVCVGWSYLELMKYRSSGFALPVLFWGIGFIIFALCQRSEWDEVRDSIANK